MTNEPTVEDLERRAAGRFYKRRVVVTVGAPGETGRRWANLRVNGKVTKTKRRKPNKATFQIYNLSDDSIGFIQGSGNSILVEVGYVGDEELIFVGNIDDAKVKRDSGGVDRVLEIEAADARVTYQRAKIFETYDPPLDGATLIRRIASSAGLNIATIPEFEALDYPMGYSIAGPMREALNEVAEDHGLEWSIQNGELVFAKAGEGTREEAFVVSSRTRNLIGSPTKKKRNVSFQCLLTGKVKPKRIVRLESQEFTGFYVPSKVEYVFDSGFEDTFYCVVEAAEKKPRR